MEQIQSPTSTMPLLENQAPQKEMSIKDWVLTLFLMSLPIIGFILLLVWAFGDRTHKTKRNFSRAVLLLILIWVVVYTIFIVIFAVTFRDVLWDYKNLYM